MEFFKSFDPPHFHQLSIKFDQNEIFLISTIPTSFAFQHQSIKIQIISSMIPCEAIFQSFEFKNAFRVTRKLFGAGITQNQQFLAPNLIFSSCRFGSLLYFLPILPGQLSFSEGFFCDFYPFGTNRNCGDMPICMAHQLFAPLNWLTF